MSPSSTSGICRNHLSAAVAQPDTGALFSGGKKRAPGHKEPWRDLRSKVLPDKSLLQRPHTLWFQLGDVPEKAKLW